MKNRKNVSFVKIVKLIKFDLSATSLYFKYLHEISSRKFKNDEFVVVN